MPALIRACVAGVVLDMHLFYRRRGKAQASAFKIWPLHPARVIGDGLIIFHADIPKDMRGEAEGLHGALAMRRAVSRTVIFTRGRERQEKAEKTGQSDHLMHSLALWTASLSG